MPQDKEEQKKLLIEIMESDAKDGLYKQQTAVQTLINDLKMFKKFPMVDQTTIDAAIEFAVLQLKTEEEQIKMAYNKGYQDGEMVSLDEKDGDVPFFGNAEQYYNQTYGTDKTT